MGEVIPFRRPGDPIAPPAACICQTVGYTHHNGDAEPVLLLTPRCPVHRELSWPFLIRDNDGIWDDEWDENDYDEEGYDDGIAY